MAFEFLEHPSDLLIKATGKTVEEVFTNMMSGVASYIGGEAGVPSEEQPYSIEIEGDSYLNLLVRFLNELLFLTETEERIFTRVEFEELTENLLKANVYGGEGELVEQIKGATYRSSFEKNPEGFEARVVFDV
ncbi:MAG: archease [Actinobacteria bacterium]|nr:archease [Actinomycetota bacterium]